MIGGGCRRNDLAKSIILLLVVVAVVCRFETCAAFTPSGSIRPLPLHSVVVGIRTSPLLPRIATHHHSLRSTLRLRMKEEDDKEEEKEKDEPITLAELNRMEEESSRKVMDRLLLPQRIGEAVTSVAWLFVIGGFLLNVFGYDYTVNENHMLTIDTVENSQFQNAMRGSMKEAAKQLRQQQ
jgi:hypothetical protein